MANEATIRVRLDTSGAKGDLADLYRMMAGAPGVRPGAVSAASGATGMASVALGGGGGAASVPGGAALAGGAAAGAFGISWAGLALGAAIGGTAALFGRGAASDAGTMMGAATRGGSDAIANFLFGTAPSAAAGHQRTLDEVKRLMGGAVGNGAGLEGATSLYHSLNQLYGPQAKGERMIDKALGGEGWSEIMKEIRAGNGGVVGLVIQWLEKIVNAIENLRNSLPFVG